MTDSAKKALLPAGLRDLLPPDAAFEARTTEHLMGVFAGFGYERVKPPMLEFEDNLLSGSGATMAERTFRVMDPASQRMMGLRPDMTLQVARIAASRLGKAPRPLRLGYAGEVLRVSGSQLRAERQFGQVGVELIGAASAAADVEVVLMAVEALGAVGVEGLSVDLGMPTLAPAVFDAAAGLDAGSRQEVRHALDRKDAAAVAALRDRLGDRTEHLLSTMLAAAGPAEKTMAVLDGLDLPAQAAVERAKLAEVVAGVRAGVPDLQLTVDPVEARGFEYHTGVTFSLFARRVRGELGRGGRYVAEHGPGGTEDGTGFTIYMDSVMRALPVRPAARRVFLPAGTDADTARTLREQGWTTVGDLGGSADGTAEAKRLGCTHVFDGGAPREIETD